jgi:endonuclease/exonuclease/phosphatase family metal-dependent hydrolase
LGGSLDFFIDHQHTKELFQGNMTRSQFTYQLSDHLPLWIQINTDIDEMKLNQIIQG